MNESGSILLFNGRVHTLDADDSVAEAVLVHNGVIAAIGTTQALRGLTPPAARNVDLAGRSVLPGLIDAHAHVQLGTLAGRWWTDVRAIARDETLRRLSRAMQEAGPGNWVVGQATYGQDLPDRAELDRLAPENPLVVRWSMHLLIANSAALRKAGLDASSTAPSGSRLQHTPDGELSGVVEEGFDLFPIPYPDEAWLTTALREEVLHSFSRFGVTTIHELPATAAGTRAWQQLHRRKLLPARITLNPILAPGHQPTVSDLDGFLGLGLTTGFGDAWLRLGALKVFVDGDDNAALTYQQLAGSPAGWGLTSRSYNDLVELLVKCRKSNVQVWLHAIGDAAQRLVLDAIAEASQRVPSGDHRTRIEHIGNDASNLGDHRIMLDLGVVPVPTAAFIYFTPLSSDNARDAVDFPYRSLMEAGLRPPGNSDTAGTQPFATNPWFGMASMMHRKNKWGQTLSASEAVDLRAAVRTYTEFGAWAAFEEFDKGSIEVGRLGDLIVLPEDPFVMDPDSIGKIEADMTIVGGITVYERP